MRRFQTVHTVANEIRLSRTVFPNKTALLVEGTTDRRFYNQLVDPERCQVYRLDGKPNVIQLLSILKTEKMPGVLAIIDADIDHLENRQNRNPNVITTPTTRDIEGLLLQSAALERVLIEHELSPNPWPRPVRSVLLDAAKPLGYLRWIAIQKGWHLNFKRLVFKNFIDRTTRTCRIVDMCEEVITVTSGFALTAEELGAHIENAKDERHDPWHVAQGHDLVSILAELLSGPTRHHTADDLGSDLRLGFSNAEFIRSPLYRLICDWQHRNVPFVVLILPCEPPART